MQPRSTKESSRARMHKLTRFTLYHSLSRNFGPHKSQNLNDKEAVELCFESDKPQYLKRLRTFCALRNQNRKGSLAPR
jgi:hypothetical protein